MKQRKGDHVRKVGMIFSGGPAPAANAVIAGAASAFIEDGREVLGFMHGYSGLQEYTPEKPLVQDTHYRALGERDLRGLRNARGITIGTARANPGKEIKGPADLRDPKKTAPLKRVYEALVAEGVHALISMGGDDTLKTANSLYEWQKTLPADAPRVRVVHLPKTIDNDYYGIDFTFGFFTAVDFMAKELLNLRADALATGNYFIAEAMGRKAGWLGYGVAMAGEAHLVLGIEDIDESLMFVEETQDPKTGQTKKESRLDIDALGNRLVDVILEREKRGKKYGVLVLAEGIAEMLPESYLKGMPTDTFGHVAVGLLQIGSIMAARVSALYEKRTGKSKKVNAVQIGYEARCAAPHAFDVILGSQLGVGAYRALVEEGLDGHMVSVSGQFDLRYVPFSDLVNPESLKTEVRFIKTGTDFHRLARFLETRTTREV